MLSHKYRFHGHKSLGFVFRHGLSVRGRYMVLRIHKHPKRKDSRVAVVVSKKIAKKAVHRNRIRRRTYEAVRLAWPDITAPYDLVFIVTSPEIGLLPFSELQNEVATLLKNGRSLHQRQ